MHEQILLDSINDCKNYFKKATKTCSVKMAQQTDYYCYSEVQVDILSTISNTYVKN